MKLDVLTLEVGSTITKANGFVRRADGRLFHRAQGFAPTTVSQGDVSVGVEQAVAALAPLADCIGADCLGPVDASSARTFINSSAAGGLKMTVHGLTMSMTARAAKEASLGAGAIIKQLTAGEIYPEALEEIRGIRPNLILLAGGVDFGERETVISNARKLVETISRERLSAPLIYAGNRALQGEIKQLASAAGVELWLAENVFPAVDQLNVGPLRRLIHDAFSRHIIHAPGMSKLSRYTHDPVIPTPGAVLMATEVFAETAGDTVVVDVGGATTDVHSVTDGSDEFSPKMIEPEPRSKRTVEGKAPLLPYSVLAFDNDGQWAARKAELRAIPESSVQRELTRWLCQTAVVQAVQRHAGTVTDLYTPSGRKQIVRGKDLTAVRYVVGTGGALTKIEGGEAILRRVCQGATTSLLPPPEARILIDRRYFFSSVGTILGALRDEAKHLITGLLSEASI